ncbi:ATP-binding protein [Oceanobacillus oncorhynchi]|uniref:ATP-binding protein n=1 Tax=Oceanobacillus oncorhynchi TaxID=545501 RepID=UPI0018696D6D|nr:ATP-binding protein [Oceanobacillus oncorhynchi]
MKNVLELPVKHIDNNLIFTKEDEVWAYFRLEGFNYSFYSDMEKLTPFQSQMGFLINHKHDLHYYSDPTPTDIESIVEDTISSMRTLNYELKENGIAYMKQLKQTLANQSRLSETSEYADFIGVQLNQRLNKYHSPNTGNNIIMAVNHWLDGLKSPVYSAAGLEPYDILEEEIVAYQIQADGIQRALTSAFNCKVTATKTNELVYLIAKNFSVTTNYADIDSTLTDNLKSGEDIIGYGNDGKGGKEYKAIRPKTKEFLSLQDTAIVEDGPKSLRLSKIIDNEETEIYTQHLICHDMDNERPHPGSEWIHHLKSYLGFPVTISIRAYHQSNPFIKKKLSNKLLEFKDQRKEANKGGEDIDLDVKESQSGAIRMENYFKQTAQPAYACSFIIKVTGKTKEEIHSRVERLINEVNRFGLSITSPFGEQVPLMMETIPGSKSLNNDYEMLVAPGVVAGMMFGTTSFVGDNRGIFLGYTKYFNKPLFIKPDLAAKAVEETEVDSLSILVAGMTGRGKSFAMNLFAYLSVLTGSQGLIIDPKGDRKGWDKGLPFIPSKHISVWTLGADRKDAGSLDPFRTSTTIEEGKDICMDTLSYLANIDIEDDRYSLLSEITEEIAETDDPCIGAIISTLQEMYNNEKHNLTEQRYNSVESLKSILETLNRDPLANLLFGTVGQDYRVLHTDVPLQVLMVENLKLPTDKTKKLRATHKISEAIMISITAFTKQYMFNTERSRHKFILQDEASAIERNAMGSELLDFIVRMGRYYNTTLIKGSQNASDHGKDVANMGMIFSFALRKKEEAEEMLDYLNLPVTTENVRILNKLPRGEALFQDIYGRSAVVKINPVFQDLYDAFDTSTASKEEREKEMERIS